MAERFIPRRVRQRLALDISAEEIAAELQITTEELVVVEAHTSLPAKTEDVGRAWDLALGRIVKARQDATQDEAVAAEAPTAEEATARDSSVHTSDALHRWGEGPERAPSAASEAAVPPAKAAQASRTTSRPKRRSQSKKATKRPKRRSKT